MPDHDADAVLVVPTSAGVLVTGDGSSVDAYLETLSDQLRELGQPIGVATVAEAAGLAATGMALSRQAGQSYQLSQRSLDLLATHMAVPGHTAGYLQGAVRGAKGRYGGTLEFRPVPLGPSQAAML